MKLKLLIIFLLLAALSLYPLRIYADNATQAAINNGINYLGTQLNGATGQIKGGSTGDASSWAAIAFSANGVDPSTVKTSAGAPSLIDYLKANHPTTSSAATEWEKWILAITASGQNPYNFGGINYVSTLESSTYFISNQIGDTTSVADDWFGVLALIASGVSNSDPVLTSSLSFIISHQNSDGGFGFSTTAGSDGNDTAAAIQALVAAKNYGVINASLDGAITSAKTYFLSTQDKSGGFLYDTNPWTTAPDTDSTTWALMALNTLGMQSSNQAKTARTWLISSPQQSSTDGGFTACNQWDPVTFACTGVASNSTTTSHALIGLAGKGWVLKIFSASSVTPTPTESITPLDTPTVTPTITPNPTTTITPTPTDTTSSLNSDPTPTSTGTPTPAPTDLPTQTPKQIAQAINMPTEIPSPSPIINQKVLGVHTIKENSNNSSAGQIALIFSLLGIGAGSLGLYGFKKFKKY